MRSEYDANEALFQASLNKITTKACNRSARDNRAKRDCASPAYWHRQRQNMNNPKMGKAWHVLTKWIAVF